MRRPVTVCFFSLLSLGLLFCPWLTAPIQPAAMLFFRLRQAPKTRACWMF